MGLEFTGERYVPGAEGIEDLYAEHMARYVLAARFLGKGSVLDVGCGCGYGAAYLASCGGAPVLGVDLSAEAIAFARARYPNSALAFAIMDARKLALAGPFELVTCFEVIEHIEGASELLSEVSRVLDQRGVFLVSTPNKATYVAGGPEGTNPFHVREYTREEFEDILRPVFPHVRILEQTWIEAMVVTAAPVGVATAPLAGVVLPQDQDFAREVTARPEPAYFLAACGRSDAIEQIMDELPGLLVDTDSVRSRQVKRQMHKAQSELDQRAAWASKLSAELRERDETIRRLRAELATLKKDFDERGEWARGLSKQLETERAAFRRLRDALEHRDNISLRTRDTL